MTGGAGPGVQDALGDGRSGGGRLNRWERSE